MPSVTGTSSTISGPSRARGSANPRTPKTCIARHIPKAAAHLNLVAALCFLFYRRLCRLCTKSKTRLGRWLYGMAENRARRNTAIWPCAHFRHGCWISWARRGGHVRKNGRIRYLDNCGRVLYQATEFPCCLNMNRGRCCRQRPRTVQIGCRDRPIMNLGSETAPARPDMAHMWRSFASGRFAKNPDRSCKCSGPTMQARISEKNLRPS